MSNKEACAEYFRSQPEYKRIFAAMRKKWESLGRTAGKVVLPSASEEEKEVLWRFLGIPADREEMVFSLQQFEKALQETRYGEISLKELLEAYYGEKIYSNQEKKQHEMQKEQTFWLETELMLKEESDSCEEATDWLQEMREQKSGGYAAVMKEYRKSEASAAELLIQVSHCLRLCRWRMESGTGSRRPETSGTDGIRLAVLAAQATGNPHALDRQTAAGTLFSYALCRRCGCGFPQSAREWKELYEKNGILVDELSSTVIAYGIHFETEHGLHPAYEGYLREKEPCVISLANLNGIRNAYGESDMICIVENEMVFSELLKAVSGYPVTLLCTSGQPRTAAYRLLELLCGRNVSFWYAGDLDPEGLDIADRIWRSFPEYVRIWRMGVKDYEKAMSEEEISGRRLEMLKNLTNTELQETAEQIQKEKKAGYQELLLEDMAQDIKRGIL